MEGYVIIALKSIAVYVFIVVAVFQIITDSSKRKHKAHRILGQNTA
jgi:hypothetical protein